MVNLKHSEILKDQVKEKEDRIRKGKMNVDELLQNKGRFREIVDNSEEQADALAHGQSNRLKR